MNYEKDGFMETWGNQNGTPNYYPNSFNGPAEKPAVKSPSYYVSGDVDRHTPVQEDDYGQCTVLWQKVFDNDAKTRFVKNVVDSLKTASGFIIERMISNFTNVDPELGKRLTEGIRNEGIQINVCGKSANL